LICVNSDLAQNQLYADIARSPKAWIRQRFALWSVARWFWGK